MTRALLVLIAQTPTPDPGNGGGVVGFVLALLSMALMFTLFFGLPIWGIVDAIRRPPEDWETAGQSKSLWIVIQFFAWIIGSIIYLFAVRPRLKRAAREPEGLEHA